MLLDLPESGRPGVAWGLSNVIATAPFPNGAERRDPCAASGVTLWLYPCKTTNSTGLLDVQVIVPTQILPSLLGGRAITSLMSLDVLEVDQRWMLLSFAMWY